RPDGRDSADQRAARAVEDAAGVRLRSQGRAARYRQQAGLSESGGVFRDAAAGHRRQVCGVSGVARRAADGQALVEGFSVFVFVSVFFSVLASLLDSLAPASAFAASPLLVSAGFVALSFVPDSPFSPLFFRA